MKTLLFTTCVLLILSACNSADDSEYKELAADICKCTNKATEGLSDGGRRTIEHAGKNDIDAQEALTEYAQENAVIGMQDIHVLNKLKGKENKACMKVLKEKYVELYEADSEEEMRKKILASMKKAKGCHLAYAIFKSEM